MTDNNMQLDTRGNDEEDAFTCTWERPCIPEESG